MKRVALVTGSNRGLGLETARMLAERDWHVILACRDLEDARARAATIPGASARTVDLTHGRSIAALRDVLDREDLMLDVLVNNAAISMRGFDASVATKTLAVNLSGTLMLTAALEARIKDGGAIVMVSSGMGELSGLRERARGRVQNAASVGDVERLGRDFIRGVAEARHEAAGWPSSAYSVSKALLNAATRVLARELESRHIRVNAVCPGWVRTDLGGPHAPRDVRTGAASIIATVLEPRATGGFFRDGAAIGW
jgi:NAD(P)-dependent dehydrogenase (short-subunit alcohol dehydrogenase family)